MEDTAMFYMQRNLQNISRSSKFTWWKKVMQKKRMQGAHALASVKTHIAAILP